ncbi:hypothetical protein SLS64_013570 [Diaporthe eres]
MPDPPEWREPKHRLPDGSVTQLLLIHSAEHKTFLDKKEKIALVCPDHLKRAGADEISPIKLRWLNSGGLVITASELDFEGIKGDLIEVNDTAPGEFRTIQVKRDLSEQQARPIVIELDCKYVDFHRHAVAIAAARKPDPSRYDILWAPGGDHRSQEILTPAKWIQLLSSDTIEKDIFFLSRKYPPYHVPRYYREREDENEYLYGHSRGRTEWVDERNTNSKSRNNGHPEAPPKSSGLITFPFFTWRVKHGTEGRQPQLLSIQERDETVVRILGKIHESITSDKSSYRRLYAKAYRCGADDLFLRHPDVVVKTKTDASPEDHDGAKPADELPTSPSGLHN